MNLENIYKQESEITVICNINNNIRITLSSNVETFTASIYAGIDYQTIIKASYSSGNLANIKLLNNITNYKLEVKEEVDKYWKHINETKDPRDMINHLLQVCVIADSIYNRYLLAMY